MLERKNFRAGLLLSCLSNDWWRDSVAEPDIPYMGVEGGLPDPEIGGGGLKKSFFSPFRAFWSKNKARAPSLDPPLLNLR